MIKKLVCENDYDPNETMTVTYLRDGDMVRVTSSASGEEFDFTYEELELMLQMFPKENQNG